MNSRSLSWHHVGLYACIVLLFVVSFRMYSALYYPLLNSDNAVTILMIHYFQWPDDLYFWLQDRMGSLIPLLGQPLHHGLGVSALATESVVHYGILLAGYLAFASFLQKPASKLILAVVWFFPPLRMIDHIQFSFGIHYSLLAISCYLFRGIDLSHPKMKDHLRWLGTILVFILAVWVSDMALITIGVFVAVHGYFMLRREDWRAQVLKGAAIWYLFAGIILGYFLITFAKSTAPQQLAYGTFSGPSQIVQTVRIFLESMVDLLCFQANEPLTSLYVWLVAALLFIGVIFRKQIHIREESKPWLIFFFLEASVMLLLILSSEWTFLNGVPRRYFTCTYVSLSMAVLILLDQTSTSGKAMNAWMNGAVLLVALIGGVSAPYNIGQIWPGTLKPRVAYSREFETLDESGIIADYWNSYIISCVNPDKMVATPHDQAIVRNADLVDEVFKRENIYVVRDMWMESLPDTLIQFSRTLVKEGKAFKLGGCDVAKYRLAGR
ncbi:MAG: hypothetical protein KDD36_11970 [Flavobacteriales bacterium]|nr:hypothetical protein [Flavobacteriales bacterium]